MNAARVGMFVYRVLFSLFAGRRRCFVAALALLSCVGGQAHPLGNFTVNHFARLELSSTLIRIRYVVDLAEIPAFQELRAADRDGNGDLSPAERVSYLHEVGPSYATGLNLTEDGARVSLNVVSSTMQTPPGAGGLSTLRIELTLEGSVPGAGSVITRHLRFEDINQVDRIGWREAVVVARNGVSVFDSSAFANTVSNELRLYPADMLAAPLDERVVHLSWTVGAPPSNAEPLRTRDGRVATAARDRLAELIAVKQLTPFGLLMGLLIAATLGAAHALSPGHGKTVVGAYLVGARGTARHAAFLGLTVTATHTAGVFALGLITLFASRYVIPERLFPVVSFASGAIVATIGLHLLIRRIASALSASAEHVHGHSHSHGGRPHSHLPPESMNGTLSWRSLLALGISGGLLPCPSALVVLLSAIALHRIAYGLALVIAFSFGLAVTLTTVGLAFVYAGRVMSRCGNRIPHMSRLRTFLPILGAFVVACLGAGICYEAARQSGFDFAALLSAAVGRWRAVISSPLSSMGAWAVLGLGLVLGLKHATEADHVVAVSTMISEHRKLSKVLVVGSLWGAGHTLTLVSVGIVVLVLGVAIPERVSQALEFIVALMIIGLSGTALTRALRGKNGMLLSAHRHDGAAHLHLHFHGLEGTDIVDEHVLRSNQVASVGLKPLIVGAIHGLAGSAALTLLVLTQVHSVFLGLCYLLLFGIGSIAGMAAVSCAIGLPFTLDIRGFTHLALRLQVVAGLAGLAFGCWYAYSVGSTALG